jgi:hypothetical protein
MNPGEYDYDQVSRAGDPAAAVARLTDTELAALLRYAEGIQRQNDTNGGWPATVKWLCVLALAKRHVDKITIEENQRQTTK